MAIKYGYSGKKSCRTTLTIDKMDEQINLHLEKIKGKTVAQAYYKVSEVKTVMQVYENLEGKVCVRLILNSEALQSVRTALATVFILSEVQPEKYVLLNSGTVADVEKWLADNFKFSE